MAAFVNSLLDRLINLLTDADTAADEKQDTNSDGNGQEPPPEVIVPMAIWMF